MQETQRARITIQDVTPSRSLQLLVALLFFLVIVTAGITMAKEAARVVILPFSIHAEKDVSFFQAGLIDMLTSRLSSENTVVVPTAEIARALKEFSRPFSKKTAREIGARLGADYVLFGSLTLIGNSVSLDASVVDVHQQRPPLSFFDHSTKVDDVIPKLSLIAKQINEKVFGRTVVAQRLPERREAYPGMYAHPETLMKNGRAQAPAERPAGMLPHSLEQDQVPTPAEITSTVSWKSQELKDFIRGISLGDVDGDGKTEVVLVTEGHVHVYRFEDKRLVNMAEVSGNRYHKFIGVDTGDINGNGRAEIFVTSLADSGQKLDSFVLESAGKDFKRITEGAPWYYRVIDIPTEGKVLFGQKRTREKPFVPGVYRLAWRDGKYVPAQQARLPEGVNVFGFAMGDVQNNGQQMIVSLDEGDHIRVLGPSGQQHWKSEECYGGSKNYVMVHLPTDPAADTERFYPPQRVHVGDVNGDGIYEVIVTSNQGILSRFFSNLRRFSNGRVVILAWSGFGLAPAWQGDNRSGHVSDCVVGDLDNDGKREVVAIHVADEGSVLTDPTSFVIAYEFSEVSLP